MKAAIKIFFLIIASFIAFSCATTSKIVPPAEVSPEFLQRQVRKNFQRLVSFEGKARVIIELPGSGHNGFSEVFINFPDSIFVKTEAMLGIDIGSLFLDRRYFAAYAPRENVLYYGEMELLDLREFLQIELNTGELYDALTGLIQVVINEDSKFFVEDGKYVVTTPVEEGMLKYWIDAKHDVVTKSHLYDRDGRLIFSEEMQRVRMRSGVALPQIIRVTRPQARERITVYYTEQKINRPIAAAKFRLRLASNAQRVYWGDLDRPQVERSRSN